MLATGLSTWKGTWKEGNGTISTTTDTFKHQPYLFSSRFEGTIGASPEELLQLHMPAALTKRLLMSRARLDWSQPGLKLQQRLTWAFKSRVIRRLKVRLSRFWQKLKVAMKTSFKAVP